MTVIFNELSLLLFLKHFKASKIYSLGLVIAYVKKLKRENLLAYFKCRLNS